jgi:peptidoglycan L-alanyl-D-glutamate endopeptidase CwlK
MPANTKDLVPELKTKLAMFLRACAAAKIDVLVTQGYRSTAEQNALYALGRTKAGKIVTNAKGGQSKHNFGKAFDICFLVNKKVSYAGNWNKVGELGEKCGLIWGGRWTSFPDKPHFEIK